MGIALLIFGSFLSLIYYVFYCKTFYLRLYCGTLILATFVVLTVLKSPLVQDSNNVWIRPALYIGQGIASFLPVIHWIYLR